MTVFESTFLVYFPRPKIKMVRKICCCVTGCKNNSEDDPDLMFHCMPRTDHLRKKWLTSIGTPQSFVKSYGILKAWRVCSKHFTVNQYQFPGSKKLNSGAVPTIMAPLTLTLPAKLSALLLEAIHNAEDTPETVIQEVDGREYAKGTVPSIFNNDTTANSKESSMSVESNENDFETQSDMIVEEPEITPAPILFVSSSADYKDQKVLTTSNKQPDTDCDQLKKRTVWNPQYTGQGKIEDVESPMENERTCTNCNLAMNEVSALRKQVNILQSQNRRLDRRVRSMKTLLRHYKNMHAR